MGDNDTNGNPGEGSEEQLEQKPGPTDLFFHALQAISTVDGRDRLTNLPVVEYFSEYAFFKHVLKAEVEYLIALSDTPVVRDFTREEKEFMRGLVDNFDLGDAITIQRIERFGYKDAKREIDATNHNIKSVEYLFKIKIEDEHPGLEDVIEMVHYGLTSEDVSNLAFGMMRQGFMKDLYIPTLTEFLDELAGFAGKYRDARMKGRSHGQTAVPTTMGKEAAVFLDRVRKQVEKVYPHKYAGKVTGAVGNFNAHLFGSPEIDWLEFSKKFVSSLGLEPVMITTQIEPHDELVEHVHAMQRINNILLDFARDIWQYISDDYIVLEVKEGEVGSSTMTHKVNPIKFEHGEGSLVKSSKFFELFYTLQVSRLQRDLSGATVEKDIGFPMAKAYEGVVYLLRGLRGVVANPDKMLEDLDKEYAQLGEAAQTLLRRHGYDKPYERVKEATRGKHMDREGYIAMVADLDVREQDVLRKLEGLKPSTYLGYAQQLTDSAIRDWEALREQVTGEVRHE